MFLFRFSEIDSPASAGSLHDRNEAGNVEGDKSIENIPGKRTSACSAGENQSFLLTNIQRQINPSGETKTKFNSDHAELNNALFISVTGTWLNSDALDPEVSHDFPEYYILHCDRSGRQGGGVALYRRDDLTGEPFWQCRKWSLGTTGGPHSPT